MEAFCLFPLQILYAWTWNSIWLISIFEEVLTYEFDDEILNYLLIWKHVQLLFKLSKNTDFITALNLIKDVIYNYRVNQRKQQSCPNWSPFTKIMAMTLMYFAIPPVGSHVVFTNCCSCCFLSSGITGAVLYNIGLHMCIILSTDIHLITWKDLGSVSTWLSLKRIKEVLVTCLCNLGICGRVQRYFCSSFSVGRRLIK